MEFMIEAARISRLYKPKLLDIAQGLGQGGYFCSFRFLNNGFINNLMIKFFFFSNTSLNKQKLISL